MIMWLELYAQLISFDHIHTGNNNGWLRNCDPLGSFFRGWGDGGGVGGGGLGFGDWGGGGGGWLGGGGGGTLVQNRGLGVREDKLIWVEATHWMQVVAITKTDVDSYF